MGYAIAHPRLNPVDILPTGLRPSDVHSDDGIIMVVDGMTCEACEAETQARHIARGKRSATPGCHHPPPTGIRIGCELHNILGSILRVYGRIQYAHMVCVGNVDLFFEGRVKKCW